MDIGKIAAIGASVVLGLGVVIVGAPPAQAAINFQMPFPCGQVWQGQTRDNHNPLKSIDLNRTNDQDDRVVAAASGTVGRVKNLGDDSYGKFIEIDHGGGWSTLYAHLASQKVSNGDRVQAGQDIGTLGNTGGSEGAHLHYEQKHNGSAVDISWDGQRVHYMGTRTYKSNNCGKTGKDDSKPKRDIPADNKDNPGNKDQPGQKTNPHKPEVECGSGFWEIDRKNIAGGVVYLLYKEKTGENCVVTLKTSKVGEDTDARAFLEVQGRKGVHEDKGKFGYYAGPVRAEARKTCVKWGGEIGGSGGYASRFEHCK